MRLSFILHLIDIAEHRAFKMGQKGKALDWSFRKGDPPWRMGLGRGGKKIPGFCDGAGVACLNLAAHEKQTHICCTA